MYLANQKVGVQLHILHTRFYYPCYTFWNVGIFMSSSTDKKTIQVSYYNISMNGQLEVTKTIREWNTICSLMKDYFSIQI